MLLQKLKSKELLTCEDWLVDNMHYMVVMGSNAYGVSSDSSDEDIYGFCIPKKEIIFPHLGGEIIGFGRQNKRFEVWQQHHVIDKETRKEYDFQIYSIVHFFNLCMENNPNMIDSLFVPERCVKHSTHIGNMVRDNRHMFLHKGAWHRFKGYAYSQKNKLEIKKPKGKRKETADKYGYDVKFAYHIVRLLNECEQILTEGTLDLQRNREQLKEIRRGKWSLDDINNYYDEKKIQLEALYNKSELPHSPDEGKIKELLLNCLEHHFGNLDKAVHIEGRHEIALKEISDICKRVGI